MGQDNHTTGSRKWKQLSEKERYKIEVLLKAGQKPNEIAGMPGHHRRTIERESGVETSFSGGKVRMQAVCFRYIPDTPGLDSVLKIAMVRHCKHTP
ncbi:MAG: helix-turn-helix domain-containing protein [Firmicutes bacterium]|nr:helix-turn-helix domain-containing protein [Bacillota bacterium]